MEKKFNRYDMVTTSKGDQAIIDGSYGDLYGFNDYSDYAIYIIKDAKIAFRTSWISEDELELSN